MTASLPALRRFVSGGRRGPRPETACELCGAPISAAHDHLVDPAKHELKCACLACAVLFTTQRSARFRRVRHRAQLLRDFTLDDARWESLRLPISLAFFFHSSSAGRTVAFYPGPAGATESLVDLTSWEQIAKDNPVLAGLQPDVEALLVNRIGAARAHYLVSIDECYRLVGLLRLHWRGFSGGAEAWEQIGRFFRSLEGSDA